MAIFKYETTKLLSEPELIGRIQEQLDTDNHVYLDQTRILWIENNEHNGGIDITVPNDEDFRCQLTINNKETHDCFAINPNTIIDDIDYLGYTFRFNNVELANIEEKNNNYIFTLYNIKEVKTPTIKCNCPVKLVKVLWTMWTRRKAIANRQRIEIGAKSKFEIAKEIINGEFIK